MFIRDSKSLYDKPRSSKTNVPFSTIIYVSFTNHSLLHTYHSLLKLILKASKSKTYDEYFSSCIYPFDYVYIPNDDDWYQLIT